MANLDLTIKSKALARTVSVFCYLPTDLNNFTEIKGVITLLHGIHGNCYDWLTYTSACRYAADNQLALVCPSCDNSFYNDMVYGGAYYSFLSYELPQALNTMLKLPCEREKNAVIGLSMGGYGACLLALSQPERFFACACFSGAVAPQLLLAEKHNPLVRTVFAPVFGEDLSLPETSNLVYLAKKVAELPKNQQPKIFATCGLQDDEGYYILSQNKFIESQFESIDIDYSLQCWDGKHEWRFWDRSLVLAIDKFFANGYFEQKKADWQ